MDLFRADLHIHSRFSRATSKALDPLNLAAWARVKGLTLVGTGDFTHPEWLDELKNGLMEDGNGLYKLSSDSGLTSQIPWLSGHLPSGKVRFMLQAEISSIYKRGGKVRKIHNLVYVPDFASAERLNTRLAKVGNLASDGRPILGLDSRHLLEMVLETDPRAFLVPAHIWTPWFSLFGSKSGFDSVEECYGDLSDHIFAMETGLSSDPDMNWLLSALDNIRLISNSDAHSGEKLGREANIFSGGVSYDTVLRSLKGEGLGQKFLGTIEFFPEEGKYHLDGHRKCGVVMEPRETASRGGICPVCGKPLTVGVLNRVLELADREEPHKPASAPGFTSLIPLSEIFSEIVGTGPATKKVRAEYVKALVKLGPEMDILQEAPPEDIKKVSSLLAEAVTRMRLGRVFREPGFDGQYGRVFVFSPSERRELKNGRFLVKMPEKAAAKKAEAAQAPVVEAAAQAPAAFNDSQQKAIEAGPGPVLVVAGPGTGKTRTLIGRICDLLDKGVGPRRILAVTFTRRAAEEMRERLGELRGEDEALPRADTLHALAFDVWTTAWGEAPVIMNEEGSRRVFAEAMSEIGNSKLKAAWQELSLARERLTDAAEAKEKFRGYVKQKESWNLVDYTDLIEFWLEQVEAGIYVSPYTHVLVDEVQDLSALQLKLIKGLVGAEGKGFFAIGDPDQSIYSFRGAAGEVQADLAAQWPAIEVVRLQESYRSGQPILDLAAKAIKAPAPLASKAPTGAEIHLFSAPSDAREASWVGERVKKLLGPTSASLTEHDGEHGYSPGDVAVLVRLTQLTGLYQRTLDRLGVPCAVPEQQAFWMEPRVKALLAAAGRFLGVSVEESENELSLPDKVLVKGPLGLAAYLEDIPPFDRLFFKSREFKEFSRAFEEQGGWPGLVNWLALQSELELVKNRAEKVQIMTMHAAKGLEFKAVFLPALEDGIMPFAGTGFLSGKADKLGEAPDVREERRLFYVAVTRAKEQLFLSSAAKRGLYGKEFRLKPSRFLEELPADLFSRSALVERKHSHQQQLNLI